MRTKKIDKDPEIIKQVEIYKSKLIKEKYLEKYMHNSVLDTDVKKEYDKIVKEVSGKEERKIKHILAKDEESINRIRRGVIRIKNFEKFAREKSIDTVSGELGGDIRYVLKQDLVPEFGDIDFILKVGEISKPVKTQHGWHIIKVEDVRPIKVQSFDDVKDSIKERLQQSKFQKYLLDETKKYKIDFKIKFKPKVIDSKIEEVSEIDLKNEEKKYSEE